MFSVLIPPFWGVTFFAIAAPRTTAHGCRLTFI
jgi:hypothetical protein